MNVIEKAKQAYAPAQTPIRTARSVEAQLIGQVTSRLQKVATDDVRNFPAIVEALHENRRMWTTLAVGVADTDNPLPAPLRAQIFYLAEFTEHHSQKVLRGQAEIAPLIEINTAVLRGLNGQGVV